MPRNGTGSYTLASPPGPPQTGTTASAVDMTTLLQDIATALTASTANDGQTKITGNWNFQSKNVSGIATLSATTASTTGTITSGDALTVTKGGVIVSAGGATVTGNSTVTGTLTITSTATAANATTGTQIVNWSQFPVTLGSTGAQALPTGKLEKWGTGSTTLGSGSVTFGTAFPTSCDNVQLSINGGSKATTINPLIVGTVTKAGFDVWGDSGQSLTFYWHAIGQ